MLRNTTQNYHHAHAFADAWASATVGEKLVSTWGYGHSNLDIDLSKIDPDVVEGVRARPTRRRRCREPQSYLDRYPAAAQRLQPRMERSEGVALGAACRSTRPLSWRHRHDGASRGTAKVNLGLLSVPVLWLVLFFLIPVVLVGLYSVGVLTLISYDQYLSLQPWRDFLHSSTYLGSPLGRGLFWKSMKMSLGVSITCVILAYPVAYMLALVAGRRKYTLLLVIITPFLTSYLLRVLAWRVLLNPQGVIQEALRNAHILSPESTIPGSTTRSSRSTSCSPTRGCRSSRSRSSCRSRASISRCSRRRATSARADGRPFAG